MREETHIHLEVLQGEQYLDPAKLLTDAVRRIPCVFSVKYSKQQKIGKAFWSFGFSFYRIDASSGIFQLNHRPAQKADGFAVVGSQQDRLFSAALPQQRRSSGKGVRVHSGKGFV